MRSIDKNANQNAVLSAIILLAALSACSTPVYDETRLPAMPPPPLSPETTTKNPTDQPFAAEIDAARQDLAERLSLQPSQIHLQQARAVTWRDGSMGCPAPDQFYTQALVPGYLIVLEAEGDTHHYHGRDNAPPFFCPEARRQAPLTVRGTQG